MVIFWSSGKYYWKVLLLLNITIFAQKCAYNIVHILFELSKKISIHDDHHHVSYFVVFRKVLWASILQVSTSEYIAKVLASFSSTARATVIVITLLTTQDA